MARPRIHKKPETLNLSMSAEVKRAAFRLATDRNVSISALIAELIRRESRPTTSEKPA